MEKKMNYTYTKIACYAGYFVQAIINNLPPLLFVVFQEELGISYSKISWLVLINFGTQLVTDLLAVKYVDKIGYRRSLVGAHIFAASGLILLAVLPNVLAHSYLGLVIPTIIYALGSGLIEVLVSPVVENLPTDEKASEMSLLHSFYCWGQVSVVVFTTVIIQAVGQGRWFLLPLLWSVVPAVNLYHFLKVPIIEPKPENTASHVKELFSSRNFLIGAVLMVCAGASELTMSQWASLFAEKSLGISKVAGDVLGPCMFGVFMGIGRTLYGFFGKRLNVKTALKICSALCVASYAVTALGRIPAFALIGCGLCGFSVSLMWPGVFSLSAKNMGNASTAMFALLAVFGDLGCAVGPFLAGQVMTLASKFPLLLEPLKFAQGDPLKLGLLMGGIFPAIMFVSVFFMGDTEKE